MKELWATIVFVFGVLLAAFLNGKKKGKEEQVAKDTEELLTEIKKANEVRDEVDSLSDDDAVSQLRDKWSRK